MMSICVFVEKFHCAESEQEKIGIYASKTVCGACFMESVVGVIVLVSFPILSLLGDL